MMYGRSSHHKVEAIFKCWARAMKYACSKARSFKGNCPRLRIAPRAANLLATARPIPPPPPVTSATQPLTSVIACYRNHIADASTKENYLTACGHFCSVAGSRLTYPKVFYCVDSALGVGTPQSASRMASALRVLAAASSCTSVATLRAPEAPRRPDHSAVSTVTALLKRIRARSTRFVTTHRSQSGSLFARVSGGVARHRIVASNHLSADD